MLELPKEHILENTKLKGRHIEGYIYRSKIDLNILGTAGRNCIMGTSKNNFFFKHVNLNSRREVCVCEMFLFSHIQGSAVSHFDRLSEPKFRVKLVNNDNAIDKLRKEVNGASDGRKD